MRPKGPDRLSYWTKRPYGHCLDMLPHQAASPSISKITRIGRSLAEASHFTTPALRPRTIRSQLPRTVEARRIRLFCVNGPFSNCRSYPVKSGPSSPTTSPLDFTGPPIRFARYALISAAGLVLFRKHLVRWIRTFQPR